MKKAKALINKYPSVCVYLLLMLGSGVWQLFDWYYGAEDPIWRFFFYLFFMPVFSFVFGVFAGNGRKRWLIPFLAGFLAAFVYIFMGNGGFSVSAGDLKLEIGVGIKRPFVDRRAGGCHGPRIRRLIRVNVRPPLSW